MAGLCFSLDLLYIVSITIAAKFKDKKWGVWQNVGPACLAHESINLEVVLTESYKTVYVAKCRPLIVSTVVKEPTLASDIPVI